MFGLGGFFVTLIIAIIFAGWQMALGAVLFGLPIGMAIAFLMLSRKRRKQAKKARIELGIKEVEHGRKRKSNKGNKKSRWSFSRRRGGSGDGIAEERAIVEAVSGGVTESPGVQSLKRRESIQETSPTKSGSFYEKSVIPEPRDAEVKERVEPTRNVSSWEPI